MAEYTWCLHCEQAFPSRSARGTVPECPICGADWRDLHVWGPTDWPRDVNPDYPEVPQAGTVYPLYGPNHKQV